MSGLDRRSFFKIVAASGRRDGRGRLHPDRRSTLLPYVSPPENLVPGVSSYFATVCRECPAGCGVLAKNRDGRVIKLEGNPDHPVNAGALCIRGQSALQGLYHPDRFRGALVDGKPAPWETAEKLLADKLGALGTRARQGQKIALVTGLETGSLARLMDEWVKALGRAPPRGLRAARPGAAARRQPRDLRARRHPQLRHRGGRLPRLVRRGLPRDLAEPQRAYAADFARMHALSAGRAGTYVHVEPRLSMTAANADEWLRNAPGHRGRSAPRHAQGHRGRGAGRAGRRRPRARAPRRRA